METKRVYTKATERLKRLHKEYGGLKSGNSDAAAFFSNTDAEDNTGNFSAENIDSSYFKQRGYKELWEGEFIKLMNLDEVEVDNVNKPSHYTTGKIEVIDFIEDQKLGFHLANAVKYISRAGKKDPSKTEEDLRKAIWYIERFIKNNLHK